MDAKNKRNFILLGHAQSGKTSLAESLIFACRATSRKGAVAEGNTVSDYSFDEIERKSSINAGLLFCDYKGNKIQIIDAPGYADFYGEVLSSVRAVDSGIIVVDGSSGIEVGTERAWAALEDAGLPCMFFVNKADKEGVDVKSILSELKKTFSKNCVIIESLEDPDLMESIAESDDNLLTKYLEAIKLTQDELKSGLKQAVIKRKLFPVISGSALMDKGIGDLLEDIIQYLPSPLEREPVIVSSPANPEEKKEAQLGDGAPFSAFVFKSISDPYVGQLSLLR
ncbi:MAG: GTP-binding protein, partial [Candidatus Omnitrophica bacterium]|nr:GTP-binding protein [Candidatus Omnitrophota bacterium]